MARKTRNGPKFDRWFSGVTKADVCFVRDHWNTCTKRLRHCAPRSFSTSAMTEARVLARSRSFTASASHCNPTHFISDITQSFFFAPSSNVNARLNYISNQHPDQSTTRNPPRVIFPNHGELSFSCDLAEFGRQVYDREHHRKCCYCCPRNEDPMVAPAAA